MKKLSWIVIVIAALAVTGFLLLRKRDAGNQPAYQTAQVERGRIEIRVLSTGTIQPYTRVEVNSPVSGRVDRVEVDEGDMIRQGDILAWISSEDRVALLDAARSGIEEAETNRNAEMLEEAKAAYDVAARAYKPVPLTNSISGEVITRSCEPGQNVSMQTVLFVISDRLVAGVEVDEADIGKIEEGQAARVVLDAFPDEQVEGRVAKISREGRVVSNVVVYDVMVEPVHVPPHWSSGMTASVQFAIEAKDDILIAPRGAVRVRGGRELALVLGEGPEPRPIETGITDGKVIEIMSGLREGERVIVGELESNAVPDDRPRRPMMMGRPH
ncbi:hypothetical protein AMJ39_05655 [candidate division TA06 bacterium DG_24]|uniref:RND efflux pump membrane fusion protein barrel-sandwich domain-containing protein n=3 Tax=Bacteria division TA06 TaxID=1156500 RepID=A0A0S8JLS8_UNCT6|nr:MAG: hypothetical protein AMJ39_05655 [candidate division TA06 bacterium DG_24]KPK69189.1 MAG: hypothetical protein AMJ82_06145 [candidate division TA06 bacterium SM23_40]KPL10692.1 MAG: hypothetical protein AMJ71_02340 [candidate division TA06 bacterium SM1_40]